MRLLDEQDARTFETHLANVLDRHLHAPGLGALKQMLCNYVTAGGKRVRPQLVAWTYRMATGNAELPASVLDVAAAWELFHAFLLVHDDIIDASPRRRDLKALHLQLASLDGESLRFGTNLGIVAGDLLFSAAMCLWHGLDDIDATTYRDLLKLFSRVACTTGFGQAIDICASHQSMDAVDEATLMREYHWKTAAYTFEGPMLSGAILAGLGADARAAISAYALALGQAYQLQNDLHDLARPVTAGCDILEGKRTVTLLRHRTGLPADQKQSLDAQLAAIAANSDGTDGVVLAESLRRELIDGAASCGTRKLIASLLQDAGTATRDPTLAEPLASGMRSILDGLSTTYFTAK